LAAQFNLSDVEKKELLPSGRQARFDNRVAWSRAYLKKACLIENLTEPGANRLVVYAYY
jgi:restriction system protein